MCSSVTLSFTYSVPLVIMSSIPLLPCLLLLLSLMSFCLLFTCYFVFTYSVPYVIMSSIPLLPCLLLLLSLMSLCLLFTCYFVFTYSVPYVFMSFWLPFLCYHVFYYFCPLCLSVILASVPLLPCLLLLLSLMSFCHSGFINVKYFYKLTNLSRNSECRVGQNLPFLSHTFRKEVITIKNTIVYKIK